MRASGRSFGPIPYCLLPTMPAPSAKPAAKAPAAEYSRVFRYITDPSPENAKTADVREFYRQLFKEQFSYEG